MEIAQKIVEIIREEIAPQEETDTDPIIGDGTIFKKDLKMDFGRFKKIVQRLETNLGVNLSEFDAGEIKTVKDLTTLVKVRAQQQKINLYER